METRNFILALSLSFLVFVAYLRFFAPETPVAPEAAKTGKQEAVQDITAPLVKQERAALKIEPAAKGKDIIIETDLVKAVVNTAGGVITGWELKEYREANKAQVGLMVFYNKLKNKINGVPMTEVQPKKELGNVQLLPDYETVDRKGAVYPLTVVPLDTSLYNLSHVEYHADRDGIRLDKEQASQSETLVLTYRGPGGISIEKSLTFHNNSYKVDIAVKTKGIDGYTLALGTDFGIADKVSTDSHGRVGVVAQTDGKFSSEKIGSIKGELQYSGVIDWFGQEDKYFTATLLYGDRGIVTCTRTTAPQEIGDFINTDVMIKEKSEARTFTLYAGPKSFTLLQAQGHGMEQMVDYGWFSVLAKPMFWLLEHFYAITKNYGIAIILLTLVVRALLFYPSLKSSKSMEEMKKIQPLVTELREK
jgi:YidC/Oxa1 family membrane protein insertase